MPTSTRIDRRTPVIAAASAVAVAALAAAWLALAPGAEASGEGDGAELRRLTGAIEFYEAKYAANGGHPTFAHKLIDFYSLRFGRAAALEDLRRAEEVALELEARADAPAERSVARARLSSLRLARHDFEGALIAARAAVRDEPTDAALGSLFDAALATGADSLAARALDRLAPRSVARLIRASRVALSEGRPEDALERMGRAYRELYDSPAPRQTVAWAATMLAEIENERSGPGVAARWHRRALEISPGYRGAIEGLADLRYGGGHWKEAERLYRRILAEAHPDLYLRLAEVLRAQGRHEEATRLERRFLRLAGEPGLEALYAHELALFRARDSATLDRALEIARRDLRRRPVPESWEVMTWVRLRRGELERALEASDRILAAAEPSPTATYQRARVLEELGRETAADSLYAAALARPTLLAPHALQDARSRAMLDR